MKGKWRLAVCLLTALATSLAACNKGPTHPGPLPSPAADSGPVRLTVEGPRSVAPGESVRFAAIGHFADGSTLNVTEQVVWYSSNPSVLSISGPGAASGHHAGETNISAVFGTVRGMTEVIVVPAGTFRLAGLVREADSPHVPIEGAAVEVIAGPAAGLSATTGEDGRYRLYGVPATAEIRVSKPGYHPLTDTIVVTDHLTRDLHLALLQPRPDVSGRYTLTVAAAPECAADLPDEAKARTYTAVLTQTGPRVTVSLEGASFAVLRTGQGNRFQGEVEQDTVTFSLTPYDWYYKGYGQPYGDLVEQLAPTAMFLIVDGTATVTISPARLAGTLNGSLQVFDGDPRWAPRRIARCRTDNHAFVLSR